MKREETDMIEFLKEMISFETTQGEESENAPFGKINAKCLERYLEEGRKMGFETKNVDGYAGHVEWKSNKKDAELFAVLGHLDVVPAGEGWDTPPFELTIKNDELWGRGVQDDKGPMVATLFAMKKMKDEGFTPNRDIRIIVGCNEENGSTCVEHYFKHERMPDVGISPDGDFPAIHSEKGIVWLKQSYKTDIPNVEYIKGGEKLNMVPSRCTAKYTGKTTKDFFDKHGISSAETDGGLILTAMGVNAHGSTPQYGENAISKMILALAEIETGLEYAERFALDFQGENSEIFAQDEVSGSLTQNLGSIEYQNGEMTFGLDIRYPNISSKESIVNKFKEIAPASNKIEIINEQSKLFISPNDPLVQICVETYNQITGENAKSKKIGGGTYARELKYGLAFGPVFDGKMTTIHNKNERIPITEFFLTAEILYQVMKKISSNDFVIPKK